MEKVEIDDINWEARDLVSIKKTELVKEFILESQKQIPNYVKINDLINGIVILDNAKFHILEVDKYRYWL